jgi:hypothetical protein
MLPANQPQQGGGVLPDDGLQSDFIKDKRDFIWKVILRYDQYIAATNVKAGFIMAFNCAVLGLVANWGAKSVLIDPQCISAGYTIIALASLAGLTMLSLILTLSVVSPSLRSPTSDKGYRSMIFFGDVASVTIASHLHNLRTADSNCLDTDLIVQAHTLASILDKKFKQMKWVFGLLIFGEVPVLAILLTRLTIFPTVP